MIRGWGNCFHCRVTIATTTSLCDKCSLRKWATQIISNHRGYARRLGVVNTLTVDEWMHVLDAAKGCCHYCGRFVGDRKLYVEHKTPVSRGGANAVENIVAACAGCNVRKRSKTAEEFTKLPDIAS